MPKMAQRWPQECPRRPQDGPKSRQVGPKTAPRRVQDGLKTALWWLKFAKLPPSCLQVAILPAMLRQAASKLPPSCLQDGPKRPQEAPRGPQKVSKRPPTSAKRPPRGLSPVSEAPPRGYLQPGTLGSCWERSTSRLFRKLSDRRLHETGAAVIRRQAF